MSGPQIEWLLEELVDGSDDADIHDVNHADSYAGIVALARGCEHFRIGLVRNRETADGSMCRSWAYIRDGKLPEYFNDGDSDVAKVPAKYHRELAQPHTLRSDGR